MFVASSTGWRCSSGASTARWSGSSGLSALAPTELGSSSPTRGFSEVEHGVRTETGACIRNPADDRAGRWRLGGQGRPGQPAFPPMDPVSGFPLASQRLPSRTGKLGRIGWRSLQISAAGAVVATTMS